jgi:hypothetical protein
MSADLLTLLNDLGLSQYARYFADRGCEFNS